MDSRRYDEAARQRLEVLNAIVCALDRRSEVMDVIASAQDEGQCRKQIVATLGVTPNGASAIMELQLRRFTPDSSRRIRDERTHLMEHLNPR